jgi:hypothetical protein
LANAVNRVRALPRTHQQGYHKIVTGDYMFKEHQTDRRHFLRTGAFACAALAAGATGAVAQLADSSRPTEGDAGKIPSALGTLIPPALICPQHVAWNWQYTTGASIYDKIAYLLRMAVRANGTGEIVYALQQTRPSSTSPYYCVLTNSWDWQGTVVVQGSNLVFTTRGQRVQTDTCNSAMNGQWPIGGVLTFQWSLDPTNTKLNVVAPWALGQGWRRFTLTKIAI